MTNDRQIEQGETIIQPRKADVTWFSKWNWILFAVLAVAAIPVAWHVITAHQPATLAVAACLLLAGIGYWCFSMGRGKLPQSSICEHSRLRLTESPGVIGGGLTGAIELGNRGNRPAQKVELTLLCQEVSIHRLKRHGEWHDDSVEKTRWRAFRTVDVEYAKLPATIPVEFTIPYECPETSVESERGARATTTFIVWTLELSVDVSRKPILMSFEVPVRKTDASDPAIDEQYVEELTAADTGSGVPESGIQDPSISVTNNPDGTWVLKTERGTFAKRHRRLTAKLAAFVFPSLVVLVGATVCLVVWHAKSDRQLSMDDVMLFLVLSFVLYVIPAVGALALGFFRFSQTTVTFTGNAFVQNLSTGLFALTRTIGPDRFKGVHVEQSKDRFSHRKLYDVIMDYADPATKKRSNLGVAWALYDRKDAEAVVQKIKTSAEQAASVAEEEQ